MRDRDVDRELEAALAKYAAVEPCAGLEQRVLASLRAHRERKAVWGWRRPAPALATLAAVAVVATLLGWRVHTRANVGVFHLPADRATVSGDVRAAVGESGVVGRSGEKLAVEQAPKRGLGRHTVASTPLSKLEQFPAPEPLSEQEKLLIQFVEQNPREAELLADAQAEAIRREADEMKALASGTDSEPQER